MLEEAKVPAFLHIGGVLYLAASAGIGLWFLKEAIATYRETNEVKEPAAHRLFGVSLVYLTALFATLIIEKLVGNRVSPEVELQGLDVPEMGVAGYIEEDPKVPEGHVSRPPAEPRPAMAPVFNSDFPEYRLQGSAGSCRMEGVGHQPRDLPTAPHHRHLMARGDLVEKGLEPPPRLRD